MIAVFGFPIWIFFARTIDRFGKGLRTGARDAMLSGEASIHTQAKVFGFHRSMDTFGAVLGPFFALAYLYLHPNDYRTLFYLALLPGLLAVLTSVLLKESPKASSRATTSLSFLTTLSYWRESPIAYRKVVIGLLVFTLFNSSDVFLLLKAKEVGLSDTTVMGIYIFYNLTFALFAYPFGIVADKIGLKKVFIVGLLLFAVVYAGMSVIRDTTSFVCLFFLYGMYAAATEGISKAWISTITTREKIATAIGTFAGLQSICTMLASSLTGLIWFSWGSTAAFSLTWVVTLIVIAYFTNLQHPVVVSNEHNASKPT
jgi:MFS family permease